LSFVVIEFHCPSCSRPFSVTDEFAGRTARCVACRAEVTVPRTRGLSGRLRPPAPPPMRIRRLIADAAQMKKAFVASEMIQVQPQAGDPPDAYKIRYRVAGLARGEKGQPVARVDHEVEIQLTHDYPRLSPLCRMLTPVFHPNIDGATICVGDHWTAGESLVDLVVRIGEMLAYQAYNIKSPLDGEAAMWADLNPTRLPTDPRNLRPREDG
jgi:ubiquitin-protein ligase